jgi:hypothetical protein
MTDKELADIKARVDATTKGPWKSYIEGRDHESGNDFIMTGIIDGGDIWGKSRGKDFEMSGATKADHDFIAHARQDIPKLLDEIQSLKKEIQILKNNS